MKKRVLSLAGMLACCLMTSAHAGIVLSGTRVVYPEASKEVDVRVTNEGTQPELIQAWIDNGDAKANPQDIQVPFTLMPPIFRLNPNKGQTLRLSYTHEAVAQDRESVYWLNALEIPPKSKNADGSNALQLAYRTRIKLFFRPNGLKGSPADSPQQIKWSVVPGAKGGFALHADNPTPFSVSYDSIKLQAGGQAVDAGQGMVKPMTSMDFPLAKVKQRPTGPMQVDYSWINDYGATTQGKATAQ
ncbi:MULTISPECIES: molecular chaperone [unclassified Burkholderia]|uniref:fimbrial biogenesis chaperone n=1 Tax=unclassified Burkholderia TaxID=2613784 RepID=UPI000754B0D2|nr:MULTISPECIES: fimbria/pilus periplasmic chaperone [unclassified Burkholderia]KUY50832.1 molecular chaperone EcpD [Burkholderia sp. RF2-non_BP3]KUY82002.1 molecular chaperone EcpD [Burkholderia sp. RF4-BP95]KUY95624.1 molecular chaperone EcpD [Burkholderia sp. RF7-non_BP1]KUY98927.1 molecular chaperone EcpD [Burkholderia sp. RF7-non_BP4]